MNIGPKEGDWLCIDFENRDCGALIGPDGPTRVSRHEGVTEKKLRAHLFRIWPEVPRAAWRFGAWTSEGCEPGYMTAELTIDPAGVIGEAK